MPENFPFSADVAVQRLGGLGDGMAQWEDMPVIIPKSAPGDRLTVSVTGRDQERLVATLQHIISPSPDRVTPPCAHFVRCGGCALQHLRGEAYRRFKTGTLTEAIRKAGFPEGADPAVTFLPAASRRRVEFRLARSGAGFAPALLAPRSHRAEPITQCLILHPALSGLLPELRQKLSRWKEAPESLQLTLTDDGIDAVMQASVPLRETGGLSRDLLDTGIARVSLATPPGICVLAGPGLHVRMGEKSIFFPPGAFLQASAEGQDAITEQVLAGTKGAARVADLFAGLGTYSFPLAEKASVHAAEGEASMVNALREAGLSAECRNLFIHPLTPAELHRYDAAVLNPPRAGAKAQVEAIARSTLSRVVMVSCNPATFTRDARILKAAGFRLESARGIDQFVWSAHLEIVAVFRRPL